MNMMSKPAMYNLTHTHSWGLSLVCMLDLAYALDAPLVMVGQQSVPSTSSSFGGLLYWLHWPHVACNVGLKPLKPSFETAESWDGSLNQGAEAHSCGSEDTFHLASASGHEFSHSLG